MAIYNKSFSFKLGTFSSKKAFTLVELIIVITILAILATIAFISFQGYNKNARDGNRLATVRNIEKGLELYQLKTTFYPVPENITGTGVIGGDTVNFVGVVGEEISKVIGIGKGPKDPSSDNYYLYGLSENKRKYQLGITLEKLESSIISKTAYADTYYAKVLGNYTYPLKLNSKLYSMPSLLFVGPSITDLATFTGFVVDKGANLPYSLNGTTENTKTITALLQEITGTSATLSLTGVDISSYSSNLALKGADTIAIESALGIKKDLVGQAVFGKSYYSNDLVTNVGSSGSGTNTPITTNCSATTYIGYTITALNHTQTGSFEKTGTPTNGKTTIIATCNNGTLSYGSENISCNTNYTLVGSICVANTQKITNCTGTLPTNASWIDQKFTQTWNGTSWSPASLTCSQGASGEGKFNCNTNYTLFGSSCVASNLTFTYNGQTYMTTPGGCTNSTTPTCAGGTDTLTKSWNNGTANETITNVTSTTNGLANTTTLAGLSDVGAPYNAAKYCYDMVYGGYDDWFLPSKEELKAMYGFINSIGGFTTNYYWSSTEGSTGLAVFMNFGTGLVYPHSKLPTGYVRCVR